MRTILISILLVMSLFSTYTFSGNYSFLYNTPGQYFTHTDWELFNQAKERALNDTSYGKKVVWQNPENKHQGYFITTKVNQPPQNACKNLTIFTTANKLKGMSTFEFCKIHDSWKEI